jgi:hypothetical protein
MLKTSVAKWLKVFSLIFLLSASCQVSKQQKLIEQQAVKERKEKRKLEASAFYLKIKCVEDSSVTIDEAPLYPPYRQKVYPMGEYDFTIYHVTGKVYDGKIEVLREGGNFGKYPGYEVCFNESLLSKVDQKGSLNLIIPSPEGEKVIRITISRR